MSNPYRPLPSLPGFLFSQLKPVATDTNGRPASPSTDLEWSDSGEEELGTRNPPPKRYPPSRQPPESIRQTDVKSHRGTPSKPSMFPALPVELLRLVASHLDPNTVFALRLTCRTLAQAVPLDQRFWFNALFSHQIFGFFFVFDSMNDLKETKRKFQKRGRGPPHWDWKRLVREIARFESFQNDGVLAQAPGGFRNRRRIWRILEAAEEMAREAQVPLDCLRNPREYDF